MEAGPTPVQPSRAHSFRGVLAAAWMVAAGLAHAAESTATLEQVRKIWDRAPHNAFTDLVRFRDAWFCVFREGTGHVSPDGALRVITSPDADRWESAALIQSPTSDLRDAKLIVMPTGHLLLSGAEAIPGDAGKTHQSLAWTSPDGRNWSERTEIGDRNYWLWRVVWRRNHGYAFGYGCGPEQGSLRLYRSADGRQFETVVPRLAVDGYPNETALIFEGDMALCLLRRDEPSPNALLGRSRPPYTRWDWTDLGVRIGGPQALRLPDGRIVAAVRLYDGAVRTSLCWLDARAGRLNEFLKLPSGGDTSYAGLAWHEGRLWVSYYSSHEGRSSIYLATVHLPDREPR